MNPTTFEDRIAKMNRMYKLPTYEVNSPELSCHMNRDKVSNLLLNFRSILVEELNELNDIVKEVQDPQHRTKPINETGFLTAMADLLGDLTVYIASEAVKYRIPLPEVLEIIMDSNESKLGQDGEPIYDSRGKFQKGPNYWKPEPKIEALIDHQRIRRLALDQMTYLKP